MKFVTLTHLRDRIASHAPLRAYVEREFPGAPLRLFIGARADDRRREDYPFVAIAPMSERKQPNPSRERGQQVSILFGVADDRRDIDEVGDLVCETKTGLRHVAALGELILEALAAQPIGVSGSLITVWNGEATTDSDAGLFDPYFDGEITLTLMARQP